MSEVKHLKIVLDDEVIEEKFFYSNDKDAPWADSEGGTRYNLHLIEEVAEALAKYLRIVKETKDVSQILGSTDFNDLDILSILTGSEEASKEIIRTDQVISVQVLKSQILGEVSLGLKPEDCTKLANELGSRKNFFLSVKNSAFEGMKKILS